MGSVMQITSDEFPDRVLRSPLPVLVDFGSQTCGVCLANAPAVATVAAEYEDEIVVLKVDVEESPDLGVTYGIRTLPTLLLFKGGEVEGRLMGHLTRSALAKFVEQHTVPGA